MPNEAEQKIDQALASGLDIAALGGLFAYFLYQTPEGEKCRAQIKKDFAETTAKLRDEKLLKGRDMDLKAWLGAIEKSLRDHQNEVETLPSNHESIGETPKKRLRKKIDKSMRFRGV
jgi:hypothetical protein